MKSLRKLRITLALLAFISVAGTCAFHLVEGWNWFDSFYMVVITISTVGYGETHPLTHQGRMVAMAIIFSGVGLVYFAIGTLLEFELDNVFSRQKMDRDIDRIRDHYIICGAGRVGKAAARELARKPVPFVVIERGKIDIDANEEGWLFLEGDATHEKVLRQAHIERAAGLVAATTTDATNIYIVLTARGINPKLNIIARASEEAAEKHLKTVGAHSVISPYAFAGHRIAQSFLRPNVVDFLDIAISRDLHDEMVIEEILVGDRSRLSGATVGNSGIHRELGIMVLAIKRADGKPCFNPTADEIIRSGDNLIVMGEAQKMPQLEAIAASARTQ